MLPQRVRLQYETSILHPNSVSFFVFVFYSHCLVTSFSFFNFAQPCFPSFFSLLLGSVLFSQSVEVKEEIFIGAHVSEGARMGSGHVEQWEYPVLTLSLTCQVGGQRSCVWGEMTETAWRQQARCPVQTPWPLWLTVIFKLCQKHLP